MQVYKPGSQCPARDAGILGTNQLPFGPQIPDLSEFDLQIALGGWVGFLRRQRSIDVIGGSQMVGVGQGNDRQLVVGGARGRVDGLSQVVIADRRAPVAVLASELGFAIAGQIAEADKSRVT